MEQQNTQVKQPEVVQEMDKAIRCLYLELPASIADDVKRKWEAVKAQVFHSDKME